MAYKKNGCYVFARYIPTLGGSAFAFPMIVKVRIIEQPAGMVHGINLRCYHVGRTYEMAPTLANYLVIEGFALFEMRHDAKRPAARIEQHRRSKLRARRRRVRTRV